ncbi:hypothetical protein SDC9_142390 [bioreactor metagenome]|uniref:Uncharacterized protein n=1 Tax=bioreactor metagenome TaxID=1076179 RepID=A0A645E104_9ZZZZ
MNEKKGTKIEKPGQKEEGKTVSMKGKLSITSLILAAVLSLFTIAAGVWLGSSWAGDKISWLLLFLLAAAFWLAACLLAFFSARLTTQKIAESVDGITVQMASLRDGRLKAYESSG